MQYVESLWSKLSSYVVSPPKLQDKHAIQCEQYFILSNDVTVCLTKPILVDNYPVQYVETFNENFNLLTKFEGPKTKKEGVEIAGFIDLSMLLLKMNDHLYLYNFNTPELKKDFGETSKQFILDKSNQLILVTKSEEKCLIYDLSNLENPAELDNFPQSASQVIALSKKIVFVYHKDYGFKLFDVTAGSVLRTVDNFLEGFQKQYPQDWQKMIGDGDASKVKLQYLSESQIFASFNKGFLSFNVYTNEWAFTETSNLTPFKKVAYLNPNVVISVFEDKENPLKLIIQLYNLTTKKMFQEVSRTVAEPVLDVTISNEGEIGFRCENTILRVEFIPNWKEQIQEENKKLLADNPSPKRNKPFVTHHKYSPKKGLFDQATPNHIFKTDEAVNFYVLPKGKFAYATRNYADQDNPGYFCKDIKVFSKHNQLISKFTLHSIEPADYLYMISYASTEAVVYGNYYYIFTLNLLNGAEGGFGECYEFQLTNHLRQAIYVARADDEKRAKNDLVRLTSVDGSPEYGFWCDQSIYNVLSLTPKNFVMSYGTRMDLYDAEKGALIKNISDLLAPFKRDYGDNWLSMLSNNSSLPMYQGEVNDKELFNAFGKGFLYFNVFDDTYKFFPTDNVINHSMVIRIPNRVIVAISDHPESTTAVIIDLYDAHDPAIKVQSVIRDFPSRPGAITINPVGEIGFQGAGYLSVASLLPNNRLVEEYIAQPNMLSMNNS